ncbi:hypothetical protein HK098_001777 [Nowakowskiella sp. JEL0407]|nr:hypothetical protein HK098_001777 [Nowakowskiella sp. JEL0407]
MPNNKKKNIKEIKTAESTHPKSRKAIQMRRSIIRGDKVISKKSVRETERNKACNDAVSDDQDCASLDELHNFIQLYINRNDEEIERLKGNVRPGRPKPPQLDMLEILKRKDTQEYISGFEVPDLTDPIQLKLLRAADGDYNAVHGRLRMIRLTKPGNVAEESYETSEESEQIKFLAKMRSELSVNSQIAPSSKSSKTLANKLKSVGTEKRQAKASTSRMRYHLNAQDNKMELE